MKVARLAVLGVAVIAGGGALLLMGKSSPPPAAPVISVQAAPQIETDEVLVAGQELALGTPVTAADMRWQTWPKSAVGAGMIRKSEEPDSLDQLSGSVTRGNFFQGEPMRREKLVKAPNNGFMSAILPTGMRAVSINTDREGSSSAGGFILPNDRVDIVRTYRDEEAGKQAGGEVFLSETILTNIRVLAIGQNIQEKGGERVVVGNNATLEVDPRQAELLVLAQRVGQLSMTLRSMADGAKTADVAPADDNDKSLTVVRYGVSETGKRK